MLFVCLVCLAYKPRRLVGRVSLYTKACGGDAVVDIESEIILLYMQLLLFLSGSAYVHISLYTIHTYIDVFSYTSVKSRSDDLDNYIQEENRIICMHAPRAELQTKRERSRRHCHSMRGSRFSRACDIELDAKKEAMCLSSSGMPYIHHLHVFFPRNI